MKQKLCSWIVTALSCMTMLLFAGSITAAQQAAKLDAQTALKLATEAYIYGYPLVTMNMTRLIMTNVATVEDARAPMGQLVNMRQYPNAAFKDVTTPNADTLYSVAWLNLAKEPYILHVPNEHGRYYLMPMLSGWTDVFANPGTRTTGTNPHNFAIIGPNWKGALPKGVIPYKSPTNMVWILGRTYCTGTAEDYKAVHAIQDQYKLVPLSAYGKSYTPPQGKVDSSIDMKTAVREQVNTMDAQAYFNMLATLMKDNPPLPADASMVAKLARLGIVPGQEVDIKKFDPVIAKGLEQSVKTGQEQIMAYERKEATIKNGWLFPSKTGLYGTNYLQRALITAIGLGANRPQDAIYILTTVDSKEKLLNGAAHYVIHFAPGRMPPVNGFWSLTMYNDKYFFVENSLNRYKLSPRDALKYNKDGSLDLYIQHNLPDKNKQSNWLPAPKENFILMFRFYWPKAAIIDGNWNPPVVQQVP